MKGEDQPYSLTIENAGFFRINDSLLRMEDELTMTRFAGDEEGVADEKMNMVNLTPGERVLIDGQVNCKYAGNYDVGLLRVSFFDPFGIYGASFDIPSPYRVTVMPMITDVANNVLDFENLKNGSRIKSLLLKEPTPGNEIRPYRVGDPIKQIHWKASAAAGEMMTRTPELLDLKKISLILISEISELKKNDPVFIKRRDYFLEFAVSAVYYHAQKGESIQVVYPRGEIKNIQVATLENFSEFYEDISKGPFYNRDSDKEKLETQSESMAQNGQDGIIITVRESEYGTEHFLEIRNGD
ncbi:DUF58 domain-containing protein [Butyrivibrio sp. JL13D10]|uniref:DUF58 domain-containing protein n=1 Tax=Butyrivibrio sp. JL13D10 TaxID=3236815 RepID=UPI0038B42387